MSVWQIIDSILFKPLQLLFEVLYMMANSVINNPGLSIIVLSLVMNFLVLPLYRRADAMQEEERDMEARLHKGVSHIKKTFKGDEKMMVLQTYYRQNNYKPTYVLKGAISLFLEIPFFIAAYRFLSGLQLLKGVSFGPIADLGSPDALLKIGALTINVLPIIMTAVNLISCVIFTKGATPKTKIQLYAMAVFFLFFLYTSPSGLVFYWTLNNIFSLVKTIFYKLKNPKKVLSILASVIGIIILAVSIWQFDSLNDVQRGCVIALGVLLQIPGIAGIIKKFKKESTKELKKPQKKIFICCGIFLTILTGLVIPLSVIKSNPQEFVYVTSYEHPIVFAISAFCIALGTFLVWFNIFYWLASDKGKHTMNAVFIILCGVFTVDFMLFGKNLGNMSPSLKYDNGVNFGIEELTVNIAAVLGVTILLTILYKLITKHMFKVLAIVTLAIAVLVPADIIDINSSLGDIVENISATDKMPTYTLSKNGKNVVILMIDRAMGNFLPIIFNKEGDRPELLKKFDGFTAYTNVVSYGTSTNISTPSLFAGYEYTPENINKREDEKLVDKHNEALKVLPAIFEKNGYKITLSDPVYANYQWYPDVSIFDGLNWNICISNGRFTNADYYQRWRTNNLRNFFCYSIMKSAPVAFQNYLYNNAVYFNSSVANGNFTTSEDEQVVENISVANGIDSDFEDGYEVLTHLSDSTIVSDSSDNTFMTLTNNTTHEPILLQEPEFEPKSHVDNTEYDKTHADRFSLAEKNLTVTEPDQMAHYQANVATYIQLGKWFDYLREQGVYDNTRIILVSDHGRKLELDKSKTLSEGYEVDIFYPVMLIKDFNSKGFTFNDEFMTLADVPALSLEGIDDEAVNPFTGNKIFNEYAKDEPVYISASFVYSVNINNGNKFSDSAWFKVSGKDMNDVNNWKLQEKVTSLPIK